MCGIAGVVGFDGPIGDEEIRQLTAGVCRRGPDDEAYFTSPGHGVRFGFRRLAILDLETGRQPISNEDGTVVSVFNGEIYNHAALRRELISHGHRFATDHADSEVIPHGYEQWGERFVERLRGMFAIGLWDERRGRLVLARDRLGEKPLYYRHEGSRLAFASEIGPLERSSDHVDLEGLALFLTYQYIAAPSTILGGIRKLEPGEIAVFERGSLQRRRYWRVEDLPADSRESSQRVRQLIEEAIVDRCAADVPVGAFLSGGVDSSVVTALLTRSRPGPIHTFSIGFPRPELDETAAAERVASALGTEHHVIRMDEVDASSVEGAVDALGEPLADAASVPTYLLAEHARRWVKVVLTGEGADELFGGYARYRYQHRLDRLLRLPRPIRRVGAVGSQVIGGVHRGFPARMADLLAARRELQAREWRAVMPRRARRALLPGLGEPRRDPVVEAAKALGPWTVTGSFATDLATWVPEDLLVKVDRTTMAHGLEARPPFLDHVLVEAVLALPPHARWRPGRDKALLRDFAADFLPPETASRPKQTFTTPMDAWLAGPLWASWRSAREALLDFGVQPRALTDLEQRSLGGGRDGGQWAWVMYTLGRWLVRHPKATIVGSDSG